MRTPITPRTHAGIAVQLVAIAFAHIDTLPDDGPHAAQRQEALKALSNAITVTRALGNTLQEQKGYDGVLGFPK